MWKDYRIGISWWGLMAYCLQLLPNLVWVLWPPVPDVLALNTSPYLILEILEKAGGILTAIGLVLLKRRSTQRNHRIFWMLAVLFLCGYYAAWGCYFAGIVHPWLLITGIAAMPPLCFAACAVWLRNYPVLLPCALFGTVHIVITCQTYL